MNSYEALFQPRRLMLANSLGPLSAGLQVRVFLSAQDKVENTPRDLVTFTLPHFLMGGAYLWHQAGTVSHIETSSLVPFFRAGVHLAVNCFYPFHGRPGLGVSLEGGALTVFQRSAKSPNQFEFCEELSEKFGIGLLEQEIGSIPACKLEIRDINHDGLPDVIVGENEWAGY